MSDPDTKDGTESDGTSPDVAPGEMTLGEELTTILDDLTGESDEETDDESDEAGDG